MFLSSECVHIRTYNQKNYLMTIGEKCLSVILYPPICFTLQFLFFQNINRIDFKDLVHSKECKELTKIKSKVISWKCYPEELKMI